MNDRGDAARSDSRTGADGGAIRSQFSSLVDALDDGIYQLDADGRFVRVTDSAVELTGYDREDLLGEHVSIVLDERDVAHLEREIRSRLSAGADDDATYDLAIETADGRRRPCEMRFSLLFDDGAFAGTVGTVREVDVGDRDHDHLTSIWETYDSIASIVDEADVGVVVLDEEFEVAWIDQTVEEYFGVDRSDLVGRDKRSVVEGTMSDRVADPERFVDTLLETYDDNSYVERFECRVTPGPDREGRWVEHRSKPIESGRYAGGRVELYYDVTDRKESERAQAESEHRFYSLVDAVEEYAIFMLDTEGRVVSWNEGAARIKGYEAPEILGEHFSTFYTEPARADGIPERNLARARAAGSVEDEGWRVRADGSRFWANVTITAIREAGELQGYAKVTRDMTDRREREQQLQRERDLTDRILETSPVGIAVVDADGSTDRANERLASLFGVTADEMSSYAVDQWEMYDAEGDRLPAADRPAARVFETGEPVYDREVLLDPPAGRQRWLSINATPITDDTGDPEQVVVTATDVTELKELAQRRKRELEEREKELAAVRLATNLFETGEQPVEDLLREFVTNLPKSFRRAGDTAARVAVGDHEATTDDYEPRDRSITARGRTDNGTPVSIEVVSLDEQPEPDPFFDEAKELIDTLATLLTFHFERREYIDDLQAETRRLEQFAYAASHDLQEPLRMVSSYLQLIERRYDDALDEDGREFLQYAVDGAERMREMIDGLLAYSRVETRGDPFEAVDLEDVLDDVLTDLEVRIAETGAEITADSLPTVRGDDSQLRQVFQNLLDNAIEYSEGVPRIHVSADRRGPRWTVSVSDEGIGIDPDETDRIFEVFQRLHARDDHAGTGIGLALCRRIVERHDGEIWVDSEPGEGSTFSFTLPAARDGE